MVKEGLKVVHVAVAIAIALATLAVLVIFAAGPDEFARRRGAGFLMGVVVVNAFAMLYFVKRSRHQRASLGIMVTQEGASGFSALLNDFVALLVPVLLLLAVLS